MTNAILTNMRDVAGLLPRRRATLATLRANVRGAIRRCSMSMSRLKLPRTTPRRAPTRPVPIMATIRTRCIRAMGVTLSDEKGVTERDCCWIGEPCLEHNPQPILDQAKYAAVLLEQAQGALQNLITRIEKGAKP